MAEIQRSYCTIYSPIDGLIGKTQAKVGEFVGKDPNPVILNTVSDIEKIRVEFFLPENVYLELARSIVERSEESEEDDNEERAELVLILGDGSIFEYPGTVDFIDREVNPNTGSGRSGFPTKM
jgi:membrane fusion protein (multidrug efflux system)